MAGVGTHQIAVLGAIGRGLMTLDELDAHLPIKRRDIVKAACKLVAKALIERQEKGVFRLGEKGKRVLEEGGRITSGPNGPHRGGPRCRSNTFRQRLWAGMRMQKRFTVPSLLLVCSMGNERNPHHNAQRYLRLLVRAGYVAEMGTREAGAAETSNGFKVYRLVRDVGSIAPVLSKGQMIDLNADDEEKNHELVSAA